MLQRLKHRTHNEDGFTLVELLVVILIIGILAAIALPTFLGQSDKAKDASAKSNARNAVSVVESCGTDAGGDYSGCNLTGSGLDNTTLPAKAKSTYTVTATSDSGNTFTIQKTGSGTVSRSCTKAANADGSCKATGNSW